MRKTTGKAHYRISHQLEFKEMLARHEITSVMRTEGYV